MYIKKMKYIEFIYVKIHTLTYKGLRKTICMVFINLKDNEKPTVNK